MSFQPSKFFDHVRAGLLGPSLDTNEVTGCDAVLKAMAVSPISHCAYALATAYHETNATMQPVREAYWLSENWRKNNLRYYPHYGRGYVQLTWPANYAKADAALSLGGTLAKKLDRAMEPEIAALILRRGMDDGWFAGDSKGRHKFKRHLPTVGAANLSEFTNARRIINGVDKNVLIARHALQFQAALLAGGWL